MGHRHLQKPRDPIETGGRHPVDTAFVFLDLPEGNAGCVSHVHLAQAHHHSPLAQTPADMGVDAIGFCFVFCAAAASSHEEIEVTRAR
jgi:hypothetical protein